MLGVGFFERMFPRHFLLSRFCFFEYFSLSILDCLLQIFCLPVLIWGSSLGMLHESSFPFLGASKLRVGSSSPTVIQLSGWGSSPTIISSSVINSFRPPLLLRPVGISLEYRQATSACLNPLHWVYTNDGLRAFRSVCIHSDRSSEHAAYG